jgi:hypothetical protein
MALNLPTTSPPEPEPEKIRDPLADRTLSDLQRFIENCYAFGLKSHDIITIVDNDGKTHGISGFIVSLGRIKMGLD